MGRSNTFDYDEFEMSSWVNRCALLPGPTEIWIKTARQTQRGKRRFLNGRDKAESEVRGGQSREDNRCLRDLNYQSRPWALGKFRGRLKGGIGFYKVEFFVTLYTWTH